MKNGKLFIFLTDFTEKFPNNFRKLIYFYLMYLVLMNFRKSKINNVNEGRTKEREREKEKKSFYKKKCVYLLPCFRQIYNKSFFFQIS